MIASNLITKVNSPDNSANKKTPKNIIQTGRLTSVNGINPKLQERLKKRKIQNSERNSFPVNPKETPA